MITYLVNSSLNKEQYTSDKSPVIKFDISTTKCKFLQIK